jgi:hypothetical protein
MASIKFGRSKHMEKVALKDILKHPIWADAHCVIDSCYDEERQVPVVSTDDVNDEVASLYPMITFRVEGTGLYGTGQYHDEDGVIYAMSLWSENHWVALEEVVGLSFPATLIAVPTIHKKKNVRFICRDGREDKAHRE